MPALVDLVIPVRAAASGKSRLARDGSAESDARRASLAAAIALDTVSAARAARGVGELVVVGELAEELDGVRVLPDPGSGLLPAIAAGLAALSGVDATAVLLGDLPVLRPEELDAALGSAAEHPLAFVADAEGTGTSLIVARAGVRHRPCFGAGSAARHRAAGYVELALPVESGLRRDVDTLEQLMAAARLPLGPRTRALL